MVKFADFIEAEKEILYKISERATKKSYDYLNTLMDISSVYSTTPLKLNELLEADDFNFFHDISGINVNLNRETGLLMNCFLPRFCK